MSANYDNASWFYERLSKLVFGQAQVKAQEYFLDHIQPNSHILIIGGGTGQILESLTHIYPSGLHITYVEISANMMALSRQKNIGQNNVTYVTQDIASVTLNHLFDVVITAFLFDNFSDEALVKIFPPIHRQLKPGGVWLNTDFQLTGPLWQKLMLKSMYIFFKLLKAVDVTYLPNVKPLFKQHGYHLANEKTFYGEFIAARMYVKGSGGI